MKYTRLEIGGKKMTEAQKIYICFFILIPIISILFGWYISKFIMLRLNPLDKNSVVTNNIKKDQKIYLLQLGVFSNEANAKVLIDNLKKIDIYSYYYKDNDVYRIITDISTSSDAIEKRRNELEKKGLKCIIKEINFENKNDLNKDMYEIVIAQIKLKDGQVSLDDYKLISEQFYKRYMNDKKMENIIKYLKNYDQAYKVNSSQEIISALIKNVAILSKGEL